MPKQLITVPTTQGINKDLSPYVVPNDVWTEGSNIQFADSLTKKRNGVERVFGSLGPSSTEVAPYWAIDWTASSLPYWVYADATKVYRLTGSSRAEITRGSGVYTSTTEKWNGGVLGGMLFVNNGADKPQYMLQAGSVLADLPASNWPSTYTSCKVMRVFKNYLIAMNITDSSSVKNVNRIGWSDALSDYNTLPLWDITSATQNAGQNELGETDGVVLDGMALKDNFMVYKQDSVWSMRHIGGDFIFDFDTVFDDVGMLTDSCVASFDGKHFVVGRDDVYIHDGVTKKSVISEVLRKALFQGIEKTLYQRTFVVPNYASNEIYVCFVPTNGSGYPTKAYAWNWLDNTWSTKIDIPESCYATFGVINDTAATTDWTEAGTWNADATTWDETDYNPTNRKVLFCAPVVKKLYEADSTNQLDGVNYVASIEKTGSTLNGLLRDDRGRPVNSSNRVKFISALYPRFEGTGTVNISVGTEMNPEEGIEWSTPQVFTIGSSRKVDFRKSGVYVGVKFESEDSNSWALSGYDIEVTLEGGK